LAQMEHNFAWLAIMITIGIMIGEGRARAKMHK